MVLRRTEQGRRPRAEMARKTKGVAVTRRVRNAVKSGAGAGTQESPPRRENEETGQPLALVLSAGPGQDSKPKAGLQAQGRSASASQSCRCGRQVTTQAPLEVG